MAIETGLAIIPSSRLPFNKSERCAAQKYHFDAQLSCAPVRTLLLMIERSAAIVSSKPDAMPTWGCQPISFSARLQSNFMRAKADLTR
jgi:hypothetical protein